jgi:diguanylate cyclase (GGDEF)-like protein
MSLLGKYFFGNVEFPENEEYREFQYKFLMVLMAVGVLATVGFIIPTESGAATIPVEHVRSMTIFTFASVLLFFILRGRKQLFMLIAWVFEVISLLELSSAMIYVPGDELRILWLFTNIPGAYLLLGRTVGACVSIVIISGLILGNSHMAAPYSANALATAVISMIYSAAFFHAYARQSIYFYMRMRSSNEKLKFMATRDPLTGMLNARSYYEICEGLIKLAHRNKTPYSVLFVDLDHFKSINDTYGHAAGDLVLKAVADCLTNNLRESDVLGRIGGEEFSLFLPNTSFSDALNLAEHMRFSIESIMPDVGETKRKITASIGVAKNEHSEQSMLEIQQQADIAMYRAKAAGRNRVSSLENA